MSAPPPLPGLARRLGTADAVVVGLGAMLGAGVFSAFAPAARAAGTGLLLGLALAGAVAGCNATASAQLAAQYPTSGGTYVPARERLGEWTGFLAGWSFVVGKTASCAAMALTFASYAVPEPAVRPVAVAAVAVLTAVSCAGVTRTARLTKSLVAVVLCALAVVVAAALTGRTPTAGHALSASGLLDDGWYGVLQSAGLLFFAFAGYARITTLGEEVRDPARTIPRAVRTALGIVLVVYLAVAVSLLTVLGADGVAATPVPLAAVVEARGWSAAGPAVRVGAAAGALGALLALSAGIARTTLAMARTGDLPSWLAAVHPVRRVPQRAQLALGAAVSALVLTTDLRGALGFSSFGVLLYYLVANLAAWTQEPPHRRTPRLLQLAGAGGCALLALTLPPASVLAGGAVLAVGAGSRLGRRSLHRRPLPWR